MDAIVLAAGKGTRLRPLTNDTPKPLLTVQGRPILERTLLGLDGVADRVIVVVKYLKEQIIAYMEQQDIFKDYEIVEQLPEPLGTGHAVQCCQPLLTSDEFIVMNGDDLYDPVALRGMKEQGAAIMAALRDDAPKWGVIVSTEDQKFVRIHEKPEAGLYPPPVYVNIGVYKLTRQIFDYDIQKSSRGEYEITDYVNYLSQQVPIKVIRTDFWVPIGTPQDLEQAQTITLPTVGK